MNRRDAIRATAVASSMMLSGCAARAEYVASHVEDGPVGRAWGSQTPWGTDPVGVGVTQDVPARRGFVGLVQRALDYWEGHSERYAGYPVTYRLRPNATDSAIDVTLVDGIDVCGETDHDGTIVGCAPLVRGRPPAPTTVRIADGYDDERTLGTIKHELGHTLGLTHDDEPRHIMSEDIADRIPDYDRRRAAFDRYAAGVALGNRGTKRWNEGVARWNDDDYDPAIDRFGIARQRYREQRGEHERAAATVTELGLDAARELCATAIAYAEHMMTAAAHMEAAATHASARRHRRAGTERDAASNCLDAAKAHEIRTSGAFARAVGLPT
ncbi:hypothetical protein ACNS7O_12925 [Haloferacaceae archaeon DSL9]